MQTPVVFSTTTEVRYAETDAMGVVHHSVYAVWMELARIGFLRRYGLAYEELEKQGYAIPVVEINIRYFRPARFGSVIRLEVGLKMDGSARFSFEYSIYCENELLARSFTGHVFTRQGKPCRPPGDFVRVVSVLTGT